MSPKFRSGFCALIGRPNAGKSSFLNACVGAHVAPATSVAQTTRRALRAVVTTDSSQIILVDTPGFHKPKDELGSLLNDITTSQAKDADVILFALDATAPFGRGDAFLLARLNALKTPVNLLITKADLATKDAIEAQVTAATAERSFDHICITSAKTHEGIQETIQTLAQELPEGPLWYPAQTVVESDDASIAQAFIEEQIMLATKDEIPHAAIVEVEEVCQTASDLLVIEATIFVERDSQKAIVIGKGGATIKQIGSQARLALQTYFNERVYLDLRVKTREKWRSDQNLLRRLGV